MFFFIKSTYVEITKEYLLAKIEKNKIIYQVLSVVSKYQNNLYGKIFIFGHNVKIKNKFFLFRRWISKNIVI